MPRIVAIVLRSIQKKSLAAMPMVLKRMPSHATSRAKAIGLTWDSVQ